MLDSEINKRVSELAQKLQYLDGEDRYYLFLLFESGMTVEQVERQIQEWEDIAVEREISGAKR